MSANINCAIYARYSSHNQREVSIEDQVRNCRELAISKGWIVLEEHIYYDTAVSGREIAPREQFKQMLKTAMSGDCPFQRILVDDTSRIARNTRESLEIFSLITFHDVHLYFVSQGIDTSHDSAEEMITIHGLIDSLYIKNLARQTHRGIEGQILRGYSGGGKRYGYRSEPVYSGKVDIYGNPEVEGYRLKIHPEEADTVIRIFKLFGEEGLSARKIVNILNSELKEMGSPKPPRGKYWAVSTLLGSKKRYRGILNNELYIGRYYWNRIKHKRNPQTGKKKTEIKDRNEWLVISKPELQIVSDELWEKAKSRQRKIKKLTDGRYTKGKALYSGNLLTGILRCGECGGNVVIVSGGRYAKYGCSNHWNKGESVCGNEIKIRKEDLEGSIINSLKFDFRNNVYIRYLTERVNTLIAKEHRETRQKWRKEALSDYLKKTEKEIENLLEAIKAGIITETVREKLFEAEKKKQEIRDKMAALYKDNNEPVPLITPEKAKQHLTNLRKTLNLHPVLGREVLLKLISSVIINACNGEWEAVIHKKYNMTCRKTKATSGNLRSGECADPIICITK